MFTNNRKILLNALLYQGASSTSGSQIQISGVKDINGNNVENITNYQNVNSQYSTYFHYTHNLENLLGLRAIGEQNTSASFYGTFLVGTGTNDEDASDYTITNAVEITPSTAVADAKLTKTAVYSNTSSNAVTITELGFCVKMYTTSGGAYSKVLIYRKKLDNPVIVPAGDSATFVIVWDISGQ